MRPRRHREEPEPLAPSAERTEATALREIVTVYGRLSALATDRSDLSAVTRQLAGAVGARVAVLSAALDVMATAGQTDDDRPVVEVLRSHAGRRGLGPVLSGVARARRAVTLPGSSDPSSAVVVAPITSGDELTAYLVTFGPGGEGLGDDVRLLLSEHAAMICGVVLGREQVVAAAAGRARRDLIEGILQGRGPHDGEIHRWARHLGFDDGREHHVLAVQARPAADPAPGGESGSGPVAAAHATVEGFLLRHAPGAIVATRGDEVVGILRCPGGTDTLGEVKDLAVRCRRVAQDRHSGVVVAIGVGGPCRHAPQISESYSQARRSLETTLRIAPADGVVAFAELGVQRLLLKVPDVTDLREFAREVLGGLLEHDAAGGSEHLRTLSAYFGVNCSPRRAAASLHIHPNTVSYRIRRIEELTGLSLDVHRDRLLAEMAVEILLPSEAR
jgi:sugar diacid utilization regulator